MARWTRKSQEQNCARGKRRRRWENAREMRLQLNTKMQAQEKKLSGGGGGGGRVKGRSHKKQQQQPESR